METNSQQRRHSQSVAVTTVSDSTTHMTVPLHRTRSHSTSSPPPPPPPTNGTTPVCPPPLAAHILQSAKLKIKEIEDKDSTGFLHYMDDQVHDTWNGAKSAVADAHRRLLYLHELPIEWQENEYVLSGYRFYHHHHDCLKSIFMLHNETMNIHSHLIGFIFFLILSIYMVNYQFPEASALDRAVFVTFCVAALNCLFCSSIYHTFICHSRHTIKSFTATLDYIGIAFLITASVLVTEHFGFYCQPEAARRYMVFTGLMGSVGTISPFFKCWDTKKYRPLRIAVFVAMAVSSAVPVIHLIRLNGLSASIEFFQMATISVLMYSMGVFIYAKRFPEKMYPGRFDFAGMTSHAIWHVFVCFGIYFHYLASLQFYQSRYTYSCGMTY
ncbi:hemolysin-III related-domain-containing protein [Halteromyces radiatus]|uniref:hemolysin-III related-domain-containing protein n=1 Tax=Halteromyces radiatus TaxID=101107 RepID=UPI0022208002|nr:hemolysin-III related-domain-containing protein [Halteromyces radiatus]KAI8098569.1 hemolysin-III related-domain-containing protein [Halteromyces radiatus]